MFGPTGWTYLGPSDATQKGRTFLVNLLDPDLGLLPEYRGAKVYWLFHDNYEAQFPSLLGTTRSAYRLQSRGARSGACVMVGALIH